MESKFKGLGVALVTPFNEGGEVDFEALGRLVENVIEGESSGAGAAKGAGESGARGGVDFIVVLGTTAETPTLTHPERAAVAKFIRERNAGRVPLVIGMGGNDTAKLCGELRAMDPAGFDAVLTVTPYYNKPSQEGLYRHYKAIAEASPLPVILYNVPGRTGVNMLAETTLRIAREVPNVVAVKEACGEIGQMQELVKGAPEGFLVLSGDDALTLPLMSIGGHGIISVAANAFPGEFGRMVHTAWSSIARAQAIWADMEEACRLLFIEGNPTGVKTALAIKGVCCADVRLPLVEGSEHLHDAMKKAIAEI